jgi:hypothetical protein
MFCRASNQRSTPTILAAQTDSGIIKTDWPMFQTDLFENLSLPQTAWLRLATLSTTPIDLAFLNPNSEIGKGSL